MEKTFHTHIDRKPDGTPFYVGIGVPGRIKCIDRNKWHAAIRKKYTAWTRTIIETTTDRKFCEEFEMLLIAEIGRRDLGLGPLVNLTDGGEGFVGIVKLPEHGEKISKGKLGKSNGPHKEETKVKMSVASLGKPKSDAHKKALSEALTGRKLSPTHVERIAAASASRTHSPETRRLLSEKATLQHEKARALRKKNGE